MDNKMQTKEVTIRFLTPAFLGDAEQKGAWRTPPFKAQLRQWWRLVRAAAGRDWPEIRSEEAILFGNAWPGQKASRSKIRLRLDRWRPGVLSQWEQGANRPVMVGQHSVSAALYSGYGALEYDRRTKGGSLVSSPAINAGERAELRLAWPEENAADLQQALALMHRFGAVGSRSRNGWGAYVLEGAAAVEIQNYLLDWQEGLRQDWVRGIGKDQQGPLLWRTKESFGRWEEAAQALAQLRADLNRTDVERCLLSFPVTKQHFAGWRSQDRLPNSLRLKIVEGGSGKLYGEAVHLPCTPNKELREAAQLDDSRLQRTWQAVHQHLDARADWQRISA